MFTWRLVHLRRHGSRCRGGRADIRRRDAPVAGTAPLTPQFEDFGEDDEDFDFGAAALARLASWDPGNIAR